MGKTLPVQGASEHHRSLDIACWVPVVGKRGWTVCMRLYLVEQLPTLSLLHVVVPQAKLGNSSVSPNVGHLILKYLCPAVRDILSDGLKAYVLDMIIGQRRNIPWSVVEASTQLGMEGVQQCPSLCGSPVLWLGGAGEGWL